MNSTITSAYLTDSQVDRVLNSNFARSIPIVLVGDYNRDGRVDSADYIVWRNAVGTTGNTGYVKNYEYDDRFRTTEPPQFTAPVESDWVIGREIVE